jgi:hypothetical protein
LKLNTQTAQYTWSRDKREKYNPTATEFGTYNQVHPHVHTMHRNGLPRLQKITNHTDERTVRHLQEAAPQMRLEQEKILHNSMS